MTADTVLLKEELAWATRTLYRHGITSPARDSELRAYTDTGPDEAVDALKAIKAARDALVIHETRRGAESMNAAALAGLLSTIDAAMGCLGHA